jgi:hypothetical protein
MRWLQLSKYVVGSTFKEQLNALTLRAPFDLNKSVEVSPKMLCTSGQYGFADRAVENHSQERNCCTSIWKVAQPMAHLLKSDSAGTNVKTVQKQKPHKIAKCDS